MRNKLLRLERWGLWRHGDSSIRLGGPIAEPLHARSWLGGRSPQLTRLADIPTALRLVIPEVACMVSRASPDDSSSVATD